MALEPVSFGAAAGGAWGAAVGGLVGGTVGGVVAGARVGASAAIIAWDYVSCSVETSHDSIVGWQNFYSGVQAGMELGTSAGSSIGSLGGAVVVSLLGVRLTSENEQRGSVNIG